MSIWMEQKVKGIEKVVADLEARLASAEKTIVELSQRTTMNFKNPVPGDTTLGLPESKRRKWKTENSQL